jgi:hypothetical protein
MSDEWPWDQPANTAVLTEKAILVGRADILRVSHDADDHGWQFLSGAPPVPEAATLVSLKFITELDPSVADLADLAPGQTATRPSKGQPWTR